MESAMTWKIIFLVGFVLLAQGCAKSDPSEVQLNQLVKDIDISRWEIFASNTRELKLLDIQNQRIVPFFVPKSNSIIYPVITQDGEYMAYTCYDYPTYPYTGNCLLILHNRKTGFEEVVYSSLRLIASSWAHDDKRLAFVAKVTSKKKGSLFVYDIENKSTILLAEDAVKLDDYISAPSWSFDNSKILVTSDQSMVLQISVDDKAQETKLKGSSPLWLNDEEFLFRDGDSFFICNNATKMTTLLFSDKEMIGHPTLSPCGRFIIYCRSDLDFDLLNLFKEKSDIVIWDSREKKHAVIFNKILWFGDDFAWRVKENDGKK